MERVQKLPDRQKTVLVATFLFFIGGLFLSGALLPADGFALGAHDTSGLFIPWINFVKASLASGELPLWNPYEFAGYPFLSNPQIGFFYPLAWLNFLLPTNVGLSWYALIHLWLAAFGMFLFIRYFKGSWLGSILSALVYGFSGFAAARLWAGHFGVVATYSWLPWILLGLAWAARKQSFLSALVAGVPIALSFLAGHTPSFVYVLMIAVGFAAYLVFGEGISAVLVIRQFVVALLFGFAIAAIQLIPFVQLSLSSQRLTNVDYEFATSYSFPLAHLPTLILPEFFGEPTAIGYWSVPAFEELAYYGGVLILIGLVLGIYRRTSLTWYFILLMLFGLLMAMGRFSPFYNLAYDIFPPVRMMRAPARATTMFLFGAAALTGQAVSQWQAVPFDQRKSTLTPLIRWTLLITAVIGFTALAAAGAVFMVEHPTDTSGRLWHQVGGYAFALVVLILGGLLLWGFLRTPSSNYRKRSAFAAALVVLVVIDLFQFGSKLVQQQEISVPFVWNSAKNIPAEINGRILPWGISIFEQKGASENKLKSVFGYEALEPYHIVALSSSVPDPRSGGYDILAAKHVLSPVPLDQFTSGEGSLELIDDSGGAWLYRRPNSMPLAWIVHQYELIVDDSEAVARITNPSFDPSKVALLEEATECALGEGSADSNSVTILQSSPGSWLLEATSEQPGILILSETFFPGWQASIDGQDTPIFRTYTALRGICIPAGEHLVEWSYKPMSFFVGAGISLLALFILAGVGVYSLGKKRKGAADSSHV